MKGSRGPSGLLLLLAAFLVLAFGASPAKAEFGIAKFEALTCKTDASSAGPGNWADNGDPCLASDPDERFYTQAAGHPPFGITAFLMNQGFMGSPKVPDGFIEELRNDLPEGLNVIPEATPQCTEQQLSEVVVEGPPKLTKCFTEVPGSLIGVNYLTTFLPPPAPPETEFTIPAIVHNVVPRFGVPSMAGFNATGKPTILVGDLDPEDQHVSFTIEHIESPLEVEGAAPLIGSRFVINGRAGKGYLTMPSNCAGPQVSFLTVHSHPYPVPPGPELEDTASFETSLGAEGCENVPFDPGLDTATGDSTDSPERSTVDVQLPYDPDPEDIQTSHLLKAKVKLPEGAGLNPSLVADGIGVCSDGQFAKGTDKPVLCPASSKIGSIEVETPALPGTIGGAVYVAAPLSGDPISGNQFRIFLHVLSERFGVNVRLVGNVFPNLRTGQLTVVVPNNPQQPFTSFKVHIDGGPNGALSSPDTCGPHTTTATFNPYSRPNEDVTRTSSFSLSTAGYGGPCPANLADRRFEPGYEAGTRQSKAGAFSPFDIRFTRANGEQELRKIDVHLPPGMVARLRGLEYCPEANIAAARSASARDLLRSPPCPNTSFLGTATIKAGSGDPFEVLGNVYLAGPYRDAPLSMVFATPAFAWPYDLGSVIVRVAIGVDPETATVHAASDVIPHVVGGAKVDIREIEVNLDRPRFTVNSTTCRRPFSIESDLFGGGANPNDPGAWSKVQRAVQTRMTDCRALRFKPKFHARIFGGKNQTRRGKNPKFRAILDARKGDANLRRAAFILPAATILDQSHIRTICTRVQLAAKNCPRAAIYGHARATSPLIDGVLKGPVYLTSSDNPLPDLLVDLRGQVNIQLRGVISSKGGRLKTVFPTAPDVAVHKFILVMKGGNRGLLINSRNLCARRTTGFLNLLAQNSRRLRTKNLRLNIPACRSGKRRG